MGECEYVLAKDKERRWFEVRVVNEPCRKEHVTCTKAIKIWFPMINIDLERGAVAVNNTVIKLPFTNNGKIQADAHCVDQQTMIYFVMYYKLLEYIVFF